MRGRLWLFGLAVLGAGCRGPTFDPSSKVESVRILATAADRPYALPGDTVTMSVLAVDGRATRPAPMNVFWLPAPCVDPPGDAQFACYPGFARQFAPGVDLAPVLSSGPSFAFTMPADAIAAHPVSGKTPYGLAIVFTMACAGRVEYAPPPPGGSLDAVPFACVDDAGHALGADDFVFAYSQVYAFGDRANAPPVIGNLTFGGTPVDPAPGITVPHCTQSNADDCPTTKLDVTVPASSQEPDPGDLDADGHVLGEEIYVDYYMSGGKVKNDVVVLYDPRAGRLPDTGDDFSAPQAAGDATLWAVVRDNRGGAAWLAVPIHAP